MRFLATCACEKIIVDKIGAHSLISVMSKIDVAIESSSSSPLPPLPANALAPKEWHVFSMWEPEIGEEGKEFEQVIDVFWPNEEKLLSARIKFTADLDRTVQHNSYSIPGFPVGQPGRIKILTWLERDGSRITEPFPYFITVKYISNTHYPAGTPHSMVSIPAQK